MCSERSGSNLITKLLNGHSNICGPSPKHIINPVARNLFRYEPIDEADNWDEFLKDVYRLINVEFSIWNSSFNLDDLHDMAEVGDINSLLRNIFYNEAKQFDKQHVFIKENQVYEFLSFLILNFPESKYVYQVRDPRDMALSWKKSQIHPGGVLAGANRWQKDQQQSLKNFNELKKINKGYRVKYEDLISEQERYTQEIVEFLGYSYESKMMEFYKDRITQQNAGKQKAWNSLSKGVMSNNKEKYKNELNNLEIKLIEKICYYEMEYLGYEPQNKLIDLKSITSEELNEFSRKESDQIEYNRTKGVKANMEAKKTFYQKLI
jgi:hypothetical protein